MKLDGGGLKMKLKTLKFINKEDNEKMIALFLLNDENIEMKHFSFYNKEQEIKAQKDLSASLENISSFIKEVYEMGKNGVPLEFSSENIEIGDS